MGTLKLDLHDIYNKPDLIDKALNEIINNAIDKKIKIIEIIPGKGSGQLKKKVIRFLQQSQIKNKYHRIDKDSKNFGRIFVHFKHQMFSSGQKTFALIFIVGFVIIIGYQFYKDSKKNKQLFKGTYWVLVAVIGMMIVYVLLNNAMQ